MELNAFIVTAEGPEMENRQTWTTHNLVAVAENIEAAKMVATLRENGPIYWEQVNEILWSGCSEDGETHYLINHHSDPNWRTE